jgi:nucleotide-binding universal stress UspA family protein
VSLAVVRHAPCAVLVVRGTPRPVGAALVAIDGSPDSLAAARWLAALPLDASMTVTLFSVVEPVHFPSTAPRAVAGTLRASIAEIEKERRTAMKRALAEPAAALRGRVKSVEVAMASGLPTDEVSRAVEDRAVDLVVLGARGLGAVRRLVLGSVAERVLRHAECPVLVVRERSPGR